MIVAGHHRAAAALLAGRPLMVRVATTETPCAVTPLLFLDEDAPAIDVAEVVTTISTGRTARVATIEHAADVLGALGVDAATVAWRSNSVRRALNAIQLEREDLE